MHKNNRAHGAEPFLLSQKTLGKKAQGAIEYLLIIGAAILVVAIVVIAMTGAITSAKDDANSTRNDYNSTLQQLRNLNTTTVTPPVDLLTVISQPTPTIVSSGNYAMNSSLGTTAVSLGGTCIIQITTDNVVINGNGQTLNCDINASGASNGANGKIIALQNITLNGQITANGTNNTSGVGGRGGSITLTDAKIYSSNTAYAIIAGGGSSVTNDGGIGGSVSATRTLLGSGIYVSGGGATTTGLDGVANGGLGGSVTLTDSNILHYAANAAGAIYANGGNSGGISGNGGIGGTINLTRALLDYSATSQALSAYGGTGYAGGGGNGGSITITDSNVRIFTTTVVGGSSAGSGTQAAGIGGSVTVTRSILFPNATLPQQGKIFAYGGMASNDANGGRGGSITVTDSNVGNLQAYGYYSTRAGRSPGNGGTVTVTDSNILSANAYSYSYSGSAVIGGDGGTILLKGKVAPRYAAPLSVNASGASNTLGIGGNGGTVTISNNSFTQTNPTINLYGGSSSASYAGGKGGTYNYCNVTGWTNPLATPTPLNISGGTGSVTGNNGTQIALSAPCP